MINKNISTNISSNNISSKKKRKNTTFAPVVFNNTPITNYKHDIFGFKEYVKIIDKAIQTGSTLIGIIGDYGSGKSSLTEICQKYLSHKYGSAIRINMWDTIDENNNDKNFNFLIRSFLYQLAQGNKKKNVNFARYINERQSRNFGKLSVTMSSRWALLFFLFSGLFLILFFSLTNINLFNFIVNYLRSNEHLNLLELINRLRIFSYPILFISIIFAYFGIKKGSFVFSLWDSQGKMKPEYGDNFDNFIHIMNRIIFRSFLSRKKIIYIEDLDRIVNKTYVVDFLKELHRFINILPIRHKKKISFILSLKSESSLKKDITIEDKSFYSKIFDYTLWIKPIHYENITEVIWELLQQNKNIIKDILSIGKGEELTKSILNELSWILKGENLTIRELKDRLNEVFILYQTIKSRDFESSSVELKKCCAVTYLHRVYSNEYEELIKHEQLMAELIRDCYKYKYNNKEQINENVKSSIKKIFDNSDAFTIDFAKMIFSSGIDEDFLMYFYNYPTSSYIKNLDEKELFEYLLHPSDKIKKDNQLAEKINRVIYKKEGKVIETAINEIYENKQNLPDFVFENELLLSFIVVRNKYVVINTLEYFSLVIIKRPRRLCYNLSKLLSYSIDENLKIDLIEKIMASLVNYIDDIDKEKMIEARTAIINSVESYIIYFKDLFLDEEMPLITRAELELLNNIDNKISLINYKLINKNNYTDIFNEINSLDLDDKQFTEIVKSYSNIENFDKLPNIYKFLLIFLSKNKQYNEQFISLIIENHDDEDKPDICNYLNNINLSLLSEKQLEEFDEMNLVNLSETAIDYFENKKLYKSIILSREKLGIIDSFDFVTNELVGFVSYFNDVYNEYPEAFINIRFAAFKQLHNSNDLLYTLYNDNFPLINKNEIELIDDTNEELFKFLNHSLINEENCIILADYCNFKVFSGVKLYHFFDTLFLKTDKKITNPNVIKLIFSQIKFNETIHFESISPEQYSDINMALSSIYKLTTAKGAFEYMDVINCLIPDLEDIIIVNLEKEEINYSDYIDLINKIKKPTEKTLEIIKSKTLDQYLDESITDNLYKNEYFVKYLIGKTIKDNIIPIDENIPIKKYYFAFKISNKFAIFCSKNEELLIKFLGNKLLDDELLDNRLRYFYNLRQSLYLINFILNKLKGNAEETKKYLYSISHIDTEKDANDFIDLITSEQYIELLRDRDLFKFIYQKMWNKILKQRLSLLTNRKLKIEPKYTSKECGDFEENNQISENNEQSDEEQTI